MTSEWLTVERKGRAHKRAAAVILKSEKGFLVGTRSTQARSYFGYLAFPGGGLDPVDQTLPLLGFPTDPERAERAAALRELGEEAGYWLVADPQGNRPAPSVLERFAHKLASQDLGHTLSEFGLLLDDRKLVSLGRWDNPSQKTLPFSVRQFLLEYEPSVANFPPTHPELDELDWRSPQDLEELWQKGKACSIAPIRHVISNLGAAQEGNDLEAGLKNIPSEPGRLWSEIIQGVAVLPLRSHTLPPATTTNCVVLGENELVIVDPASPHEEEQSQLDRLIPFLEEKGRRVKAIMLSHHHGDHMADAKRLAQTHHLELWGHEVTQSLLGMTFDRCFGDGESLPISGSNHWQALHTPGHAAGHLCLFDAKRSVLFAGDMVASVGSIYIDPDEGDMLTYLEELSRLVALKPHVVIPSHGPAMLHGHRRLQEQIEHRERRAAQVLDALASGPQSETEIVKAVYGATVPESMMAFAKRSLKSILLGLQRQNKVSVETDGRWSVTLEG